MLPFVLSPQTGTHTSRVLYRWTHSACRIIPSIKKKNSSPNSYGPPHECWWATAFWSYAKNQEWATFFGTRANLKKMFVGRTISSIHKNPSLRSPLQRDQQSRFAKLVPLQDVSAGLPTMARVNRKHLPMEQGFVWGKTPLPTLPILAIMKN